MRLLKKRGILFCLAQMEILLRLNRIGMISLYLRAPKPRHDLA